MIIYRKTLIIFTLLLFSLMASWTARAQQPANDLVYTVQPGDTLLLIALRYNLTVTHIIQTNQLSNTIIVFPGQQLTLSGIPVPTPTPTFSTMPSPDLLRPTPSASISETWSLSGGQTYIVQPGDTLFSIAQRYGVVAINIMVASGISNPDMLQVGQLLQIPNGLPPTPTALPSPFESIEFSEPMIAQGRTQVIKITFSQIITGAVVRGIFEERPVSFLGNGWQWWGIAGVHPLAEAGSYPLSLTATLPDGRQITTFRNMIVISGSYQTENVELNEEESQLLNPELIQVEWKKIVNLWSQITPLPRWTGLFHYPIEDTSVYVTSNFGTRRTYNNSSEISFHAGTDFGGVAGKPIYAPAAGRVVLAEPLTVRGNAVLIDHGLGLFSGYWHQSKIIVTVGQEVERGDLIGYVGSTGLSNGSHLHWEMRVNGIPVDPLQWLEQVIP